MTQQQYIRDTIDAPQTPSGASQLIAYNPAHCNIKASFADEMKPSSGFITSTLELGSSQGFNVPFSLLVREPRHLGMWTLSTYKDNHIDRTVSVFNVPQPVEILSLRCGWLTHADSV